MLAALLVATSMGTTPRVDDGLGRRSATYAWQCTQTAPALWCWCADPLQPRTFMELSEYLMSLELPEATRKAWEEII